MFFERRIGSLTAVAKEARTMDADAGIRISVVYEGRRCYAFLTRFGPRYTVMVYEKKAGRNGGLGKRLVSQELGRPEELVKFLRKVVPAKVEAFAY